MDGGWRLAVGGLLVSGLLIYLLRTRNKHAKAFEAQASILRSMSEGVMTLEAGGGLRAINAALERIFGYSAQEFGALDLAALGIDADPRAHPMPLSWECLMRRKDGTEFPGIVTFTPRAPENPGEFIVVIEDITELKRLERALMEASAQEQQRLGRELHDGLGQELTGLALIARSLAGTARKADLAIAAELENLSAIASRAIDTCRGMARGLSPASDVQGGLPQALSDLARRIGEAHAIEVNFHSKITAPLSLTPDAIDQVYRISQEALNNAVKHAGASRVDVEFEVGPSRARLQIIDDGPETNPDFNAAKGMGLQSMRYRASLIGARFAIGRAHPSGTKISCEWRQ